MIGAPILGIGFGFDPGAAAGSATDRLAQQGDGARHIALERIGRLRCTLRRCIYIGLHLSGNSDGGKRQFRSPIGN